MRIEAPLTRAIEAQGWRAPTVIAASCGALSQAEAPAAMGLPATNFVVNLVRGAFSTSAMTV
jgi:hypothetical protein